MDPFADFSDDSSGEEETLRSPSDGILVFHKGTEQSLCHFVERSLDVQSETARSDAGSPETVLHLIDRFCYERHWMMHIGPEKGRVLDDFLNQAIDAHTDPSSPFVIVELGTYCGYSMIRMARTLLARSQNFRIATVDVSAENQAVAQRLAELAGLKEFVDFILLKSDFKSKPDQLALLSKSQANFVFLDHEKEVYLSDLIMLEEARIVKEGTFVAADNVLFFGLEEYRSHMQHLATEGIVSTRLELGRLEYVVEKEEAGDFRDGIGE